MNIESVVSIAGLHNWPKAPERRAYLRSLHRHMFEVAVSVEVTHSERDVEFHDLQDTIVRLFKSMGRQYHPATPLQSFGPRSCEALAGELLVMLIREGYAVTGVSVSEDGENTAVVWSEDVETPASN